MKDTPAVDETLLRQLPPVLRAVVQALGFARAQEFLQEYGGTPVRVHRTGDIGLKPNEIKSLEEALKLHISETGIIFLPKADKLMAKIRNDQIRLDRKKLTLSALARQNRLTTRHVQNICRPDAESCQATLFGDNPDFAT